MLEQQLIARICIDYAVVLNTAEGVELRLECPFHVSGVAGLAPIEVDPEHLEDHIGVVVGFLHQQIVESVIEDSGELRLTLSSGHVLVCRPHDSYEAWALTFPTGELFVCLPGGGFAHWPAGDRTSPQRSVRPR